MKIWVIVLLAVVVGTLIALFGCDMTPDQNCAAICHQLGMEPVSVPIAGNPHACDCKKE